MNIIKKIDIINNGGCEDVHTSDNEYLELLNKNIKIKIKPFSEEITAIKYSHECFGFCDCIDIYFIYVLILRVIVLTEMSSITGYVPHDEIKIYRTAGRNFISGHS